MTLGEYQENAKRTLGDACLENIMLGIIGEFGEVVDYIKKHLYHGHALEQERVIEELGDLLWYVVSFCTLEGIDVESDFEHEDWRVEDLDATTLMLDTFNEVSCFFWNYWHPEPVGFSPNSLISNIIAIASLVDATLSDVMESNISKLLHRYPNGFESKRSVSRQ